MKVEMDDDQEEVEVEVDDEQGEEGRGREDGEERREDGGRRRGRGGRRRRRRRRTRRTRIMRLWMLRWFEHRKFAITARSIAGCDNRARTRQALVPASMKFIYSCF